VKLPYQANLGVVTSTVQGPLYESLLKLLSGKSMRLSEIVAAKELRGTSPADLVRAVDAGVAMGLFDVTAGAVGEAPSGLSEAVSIPHPFNRAVLASDALGGRPIALASTLSGTGHSVGDLDAAILHELVERGRDGLAGRVAKRLDASGRTLQQNGQPVADSAERSRLVEEACETFISKSLPELVRLGIALDSARA
jgi:hypothetical protein